MSGEWRPPLTFQWQTTATSASLIDQIMRESHPTRDGALRKVMCRYCGYETGEESMDPMGVCHGCELLVQHGITPGTDPGAISFEEYFGEEVEYDIDDMDEDVDEDEDD